MAFEDYVEVIGVEGNFRMSLQSSEMVPVVFSEAPLIRARVLWVDEVVSGPCAD
ncbi:hypothetical protein [Gandjariella thermophila]|uniref:Uncharacterized protein n=1 Tax=Gandjariella thermophila TaxID=1931992 RepID=A0A4D4J6M7_9PSEU|nr:hypothetical protein [Gandjariella thermophila]GDY30209.1 hypothetical protein GTS_18420 [Gandjariella thermophila]